MIRMNRDEKKHIEKVLKRTPKQILADRLNDVSVDCAFTLHKLIFDILDAKIDPVSIPCSKSSMRGCSNNLLVTMLKYMIAKAKANEYTVGYGMTRQDVKVAKKWLKLLQRG